MCGLIDLFSRSTRFDNDTRLDVVEALVSSMKVWVRRSKSLMTLSSDRCALLGRLLQGCFFLYLNGHSGSLFAAYRGIPRLVSGAAAFHCFFLELFRGCILIRHNQSALCWSNYIPSRKVGFLSPSLVVAAML